MSLNEPRRPRRASLSEIQAAGGSPWFGMSGSSMSYPRTMEATPSPTTSSVLGQTPGNSAPKAARPDIPGWGSWRVLAATVRVAPTPVATQADQTHTPPSMPRSQSNEFTDLVPLRSKDYSKMLTSKRMLLIYSFVGVMGAIAAVVTVNWYRYDGGRRATTPAPPSPPFEATSDIPSADALPLPPRWPPPALPPERADTDSGEGGAAVWEEDGGSDAEGETEALEEAERDGKLQPPPSGRRASPGPRPR